MESDKNPMISSPSPELDSTIEEALTQEQLSNQEHGESGDNSFGSREEFPRKLYALDDLPNGYGFYPTDQHLITDFLKKKINNEPIPYSLIHSVNIYKHNPQKLAEEYRSLGNNEWYFFTPRDRKYLNGKRPNRAAGNGYWKATGSDQQIYHNNACIGSKKSLVFYEGKPSNSKKSNWIMKEYMVDQPSRQQTGTNDMLLDSCVLCRIHMNALESSENKEQADATKSCKPRKQKTKKSCEKENQATRKRVKFEHQGPGQQHNLPGQHNIVEQLSLPVLEPNLPMQQQNQPMLQHGLLPENHSLGYNLESFYGLISNDIIDHRPNALLNHNSFGDYNLLGDDICDFISYSSVDCSIPKLPLINNTDHLREGSSNREMNQLSERPPPTSEKELSRGTRSVSIQHGQTSRQ